MKKTLTILLAFVLVIAISIGGTLAYLSSTDKVQNTFTVGKVKIDLKEMAVDEYGEKSWDTGRTEIGVKYKLVPGLSYIKMPMVYVEGGSEPCYLRLRITINNVKELQAIADAHPAELKNPDGTIKYSAFMDYGTEAYSELEYVAQDTVYDTANNTATTDYWYSPKGRDVNTPIMEDEHDVVLNTLFGGFTVPSFLTGEELATLKGLTMDIEAHAIQAASFYKSTEGYGPGFGPDNSHAAADAWAAFDGQMNK